MTTPARKTHMPVVHKISKTITYADAAAATGQIVGVLPSGAVIDKTTVLTSTAWNGTTSVTVSVGTTLTGTGFINATDVRTAIARVDTVVPAAVAGPIAADTTVYASVTFGGTTGSAGSSTVTVYYTVDVG